MYAHKLLHRNMDMYTYTLIHRNMCTYTYIGICTPTLTHMQEYVHVCTHSYIRACIHAHTYIKVCTHIHTHSYKGVCTRIHTHIHRSMYTLIKEYVHIYTHSYMGVCTPTQRVQIPGTHIRASHLMHSKDLPGDKLSRPPYSPLALLQLKFGISQGVNSHVCILVLYLLGVLQKQLPATSDLQFWMWGRKHWQLILIFNTSFLLKRGRAGIHTVPTKPGREHPSFLTELTPTEQQGLMGIGSHRLQILESWALSSSLHPLVPASVTLTNIMTENNLGKEKFCLGLQITVGL